MPSAKRRHSRSFCFLATVTALCLAVTAFDISIQAAELSPEGHIGNVKNFVVVAAAYLLLAIIGGIFSFSRIVTVRSALADIPKLYVPINQEDLPKKVYQQVQADLTRVSIIAYEAQPILEDTEQPGWGRPGSELENINFRSQIINTHPLIEQAATRISFDLQRPPQWSVAKYISFLVDSGLIDARIGHHYVQGYESARFGDEDIGHRNFADFMKLQYLVLNGMGFYDEHSDASDNSFSISSERGANIPT